jgi:hypothetical protein
MRITYLLDLKVCLKNWILRQTFRLLLRGRQIRAGLHARRFAGREDLP